MAKDRQEKPEKREKHKEPEEPKKAKPEEAPTKDKPLKIRCKCGGVIRVKSSKRPIKIKCPDCGKTGTLKK